MRLKNDASENDEHNPNDCIWRNINLLMLFQGVARSILHIENFYLELPKTCMNDERHISHADGGKLCKNMTVQWPPALPGYYKKFTGISISSE